MPPFAGFTDFEDCTSKMKAKGHDDASSKKICGALQSQTKGASELEVLFSAIDKNDCISKAKEYGHDEEAAQRICDVVSSPDSDIRDDMKPDSKKDASEYQDVEQSQVDRMDIALDILQRIRDEEQNEANMSDDDDDDYKSGKTFDRSKLKTQTSFDTDPNRDINSHDFGSSGPNFDDMGADEATTEDGPDEYDGPDLPSLDDNDHIDDQEGGQDDMGDELYDREDDGDADVEQIISDIDRILGGQVGTTNDFAPISVSNTPNLKGKKKKAQKREDDTEEEVQMNPGILGSDLKMQNQFTDPNKLQDYLKNDAIDWNSDAAADYNEKSDTKKIDLSYYDDDLGKCAEAQMLNGLSREDAVNFCNNLANYEGDGAIKQEDTQDPMHYNNKQYVDGSDMPSNVKEASIDEAINLLEAYFSSEKESLVDPLVGGDGDIPQESDVDSEHPENSIGNGDGDGAHTHSMGMDGPDFNHFGQQVYDEANLTTPDTFTTDTNSTIEGNDHITQHMSQPQKDMADQNLEQIPSEDDNASMRGLSQVPSTGNIVAKDPNNALNNGIPVMTAKPETAGYAPQGAAAIEKAISSWNADTRKEAQYALETLSRLFNSDSLNQAKSNPMVTNCVKAKMKANDKLTEEDATTQCENAFKKGSLDTPQEIKWVKSGRQSYSAQACEQDFGGDDDARNICYHIAKAYDGNYDAYQADMQLKPFESNNKLFVKAFLMDSSVNMNKWGASPLTLDANIRSYIGKPLVLKDDFDHPVSQDDNLQHQLEYQEMFRIGTIVDVVKKDTRYDAIAEITDHYAQQAFKEGALPLYVSPQLFKMDSSEPDDSMTKWVGTHLAIVKEPAYTVKRATVNGECTGDSETCMTYLKKAAMIRDHGYGSCGFCNYKVLTSSRI